MELLILAALPIKPFGVAKARLSPVLGPAQRSKLGRAVASRTASCAIAAGADVRVVTADQRVAEWAESHGLGVIGEDPALGSGLNAAASAAVSYAERLGLNWAIVHADLPVTTASDLRDVFDMAEHGPVLVPSYDGGTNVIAGAGAGFGFRFGRGSFARHLALAPTASVVTRPGLVLDLDTPRDLRLARSSPAGQWLNDVIDGGEVTSTG